MDIPFKPISLSDREMITSFTFASAYRNCDFSFSNMCSWRFLYDSEAAVVDNFLLIRFRFEDKTRTGYMMPVGKGDLAHAISLLENDARQVSQPLCLIGVTPQGRDDLEKALPGAFHYIPERNYFDYVYLRQNLVQLSGKRYQAKRNHINRFNKCYHYRYVSITPELIPLCIELENQWYNVNSDRQEGEELKAERRSLTYALHNFEALGLIGGGLCVDGRMVAFAFGTAVNDDTFAVHIEKADVNYEGAYSVINQEFAAHLPEKYVYVNREEDLGVAGLRQAKLSYHPAFLLEKAVAVKKNSPD